MRPIRLAWDNLVKAKGAALFGLALSSIAFAAGDSLAASSAVEDSLAKNAASAENSVPSLDSLVSQVDSVVVDSLRPDSALAEVNLKGISANADSLKAPLKTVLYLGGGERSPWFQLGVLYAIEEYRIPVDSIVATSWGAWVGSLWARGVPLDDIQKMMLDSAVAPFMGHDLSLSENNLGNKEESFQDFPVSMSGIPSMRQRWSLSADSSLALHWTKKKLAPDSVQVVHGMAKLRLQESLYRQRSSYRIPFAVQSCDAGNPVLVGNSIPQVMSSLPLWENGRKSRQPGEVSGEICPYYAMPTEDNASELSIIVVSDPLRAPVVGDARSRLLKLHAADILASQPGVIVRAHTILDTARFAWIQSGFTSFEKRLSEFAVLKGRKGDYSANREGAKPWFRFEPRYDSLSSEIQQAVSSYWNESDTGMVAPEDFSYRLLQNPAYDSLDLSMQPSGNLQVDAAVHPTFDVAVGGFGSNAIGPNAYFELSTHYVDHVEIELILSGFWGEYSYGLQPRLNLSKFWNRHWNLQFGYDYLKLEPLKSFNGTTDRYLRVVSEERSDLTMNIFYEVDAFQRISAEFIFGSRTFELDPLYYKRNTVKTYPVSPMLHYRYLNGADDNWFANKGYTLNIWGGFESIGFDDGIIDVVPIYWKLLADARYSVSPIRFTTFAAALAGGIERYHDEGHGYVSPRSFNYAPLDIAYRQHVAVTPWSTEWYNAELSSHEYGMARLSAGLHSDYFGLWLFGAYYHDFEKSPYAELNENKFIFEPALRFAYRSFVVYAGMNRIVDKDSFDDFTHVKQYNYFIRIGNYDF